MKPATSKTDLAHVKSAKEKHPNHLPVTCRTADNSQRRPGIPLVDKKFLTPKNMNVTQLKQTIQKYAKTTEGEVVDWDKISLFAQDWWPLDPNAVLEDLYKEYQSWDGILHVTLRLVAEAAEPAPPAVPPSAGAPASGEIQLDGGGSGANSADCTDASAMQEAAADDAGEERTSVGTNVFHMPDHDPLMDQFKELPQYTFRERSTRELRALPQGITLTRAWYGNPNNKEQGKDVTAQVRRRLQEGRAVRASSEFGDPAPGVEKVLEIYTNKLTKADKKQEEVARVLEKFPNHVTVRCKQEERPGLPQIDKKWLAPKNMKLNQLIDVIKKHATSTVGTVDWSRVRLFSRDLPLDPTADMDDLYEEHKNEDGQLHIELRLQEEAEICHPAPEEENASAIFSATEEKVAELEKLAAALEKEAAEANEKAEETRSQRAADYQHMLELLAAKEAAELLACNAEDKALRADEAMEKAQRKLQEETRKVEAEAARADAAAAELKVAMAEGDSALAAAQEERDIALREAMLHAERAKAEEEARRMAEERACRAEASAESSACEVEHLNEMAKRTLEELKEKNAACKALKLQMDRSTQALALMEKQAAKAEKLSKEQEKAGLRMEEQAKQAEARAAAKEQALREARERIAALEAQVQALLAEKAALSEKASDDDDDCGFEKVESVSISTVSGHTSD